MILLSNSKKSVVGLEGYGLTVVGRAGPDRAHVQRSPTERMSDTDAKHRRPDRRSPASMARAS